MNLSDVTVQHLYLDGWSSGKHRVTVTHEPTGLKAWADGSNVKGDFSMTQERALMVLGQMVMDREVEVQTFGSRSDDRRDSDRHPARPL